MTKCSGCGCTLQNTDPLKVGYTPKAKAKLCERCFKIIHYNDAKVVTLKENEESIIKEVNKNNYHVLFLIDFLNINSKTVNIYKKIKCSKTLIISKCDIIPFSIKQNKVIDWLQEYYEIDDNIIFVSALRKKNINLLLNYLYHKDIHKAYLLGFTNTGKSSLVNAILANLELNNNSITTSVVPNTTLDFMNIKINDQLTLIDSPGFTINNNMYNNNDLAFIKKINPKGFLKPIVYQLKENTSVIIEDKIRIDNLVDKSNLTFYFSNSINIVKVYNNERLTDLKSKELEISENSDLVILGLGFIHFKKKSKVKVYIEDLKLLEIRKSFF